MTSHIQDCIDNIRLHLRKLNRSVVDLLQEGESPNKIREIFEAEGLAVHNDVIEMYSHFNGTKIVKGDSLDDVHFFPGFYWMSLLDALNTYRAFRSDSRWNPSWFPIFGNGGGDFYAVVSDRNSASFGGVIGFILGEDEHPVEFESLMIMLKSISCCYDQKVYFEKSGYLEANDIEAMQIAKKLNSNLPYYE